MINCVYCKNTFSSKSALNKHQKTATYCIKRQNIFECQYCNNIFNIKVELNNHLLTCVEKRIHDIVSDKDKIIADKDLIIKEIQDKHEIKIYEIEEKYEAKITELQDKIFDILKTNATKPTIINQNNNQRINTINNTINNLIPITDDHLVEQSQYLTLDHIKDGANGYVKFALDYPLKDRMVCVDYSRRKIKYKDSEGNLVDDPDMAKLSQKFFKTIDTSNTEIINSYLRDLQQKLLTLNTTTSNDMDEAESKDFEMQSNAIINDLCKLTKYRKEVKEASVGKKPDIYFEFVKDICGKTTQ